ncbi:hypothetical protein [Parasporobacterium paucivorans]|uniref:Uncharacterized protein n=1 Tax=Parasporobacterium paucivorans DSM 15970 TaxID=1122934 RepID=A0A1M6B5I0_9FIRM|nr:hypothetical protein [Parasporobacterium paucivorans]SHI43976.1 hypothetical protein SAMN02745691_00265 [Parasporobacterium paucivorans DSM 15970]
MKLYNVYESGVLIPELTKCRRGAITKYFGYTIKTEDFVGKDILMKGIYKFEDAGEVEAKTPFVCKVKRDDPFWVNWDKARKRLNPNAEGLK